MTSAAISAARSHRGWRSGLIAVLLVVTAVSQGCNGTGEDVVPSGVTPTEPVVAAASGEGDVVALEPSRYAEKRLSEPLLSSYVELGTRLEVDWTVLAATDQVESGAREATDNDEQRISAIAYTLLATGGSSDYATALRTRGGSDAFATEVLALASRFRGSPATSEGGAASSTRPFSPPVDGRIVSGFGPSFGLLHDGLDIEAPTGAPIAAVGAGLVLSTSFNPAFGNYTCILHELDPPVEGRRTVTSCYGNQSRIDVAAGEELEHGDRIGAVGCSGPCLRPHVHLQIKDGTGAEAESIDPVPFFGGDLGEVGSRASLEG